MDPNMLILIIGTCYFTAGMILLRICAKNYSNPDMDDFCSAVYRLEIAALVMLVFFLTFWPALVVIALATVAIERLRHENPSPR